MELMQDNSSEVSWLQKLLSLMGYTASIEIKLMELSAKASSNQNYWLEIDSSQLQQHQIERLIGEGGSVIDSLQYLANILLNKNLNNESQELTNFYTVELAGYRTKKLAELQNIITNAVRNVRETKIDFIIKQLSSSDRRYIHQILEEVADIETISEGREPNRQLVVKLVQP